MTDSKISFNESGKGTTLVFLHGLCENKEIWKDFAESFTHHYRVICIDLPGFGESALLEGAATIENYALQLSELFDSLKLSEFILIGHSLGGYIALAYAELYLNKLKGLVLFHSSALADNEEKVENRKKTILFVEKNGSEAYAPTLVHTLFAPVHKDKFQADIQQLVKVAASTAKEGIITSIEAMMKRADRTHVLQAAQYPVLFIAGKEDSAVTIENILKQCHLPPYSHTCILSDTGHMGMIEKPKECYLALNGFVELCETFASKD